MSFRGVLATLCILSGGATCGVAQAGSNLVVNGDFSAGAAGFTTDYALTTMTPYLFQNGVHGIYAVEPAASIASSSAYGDWTNITTDPSGGNGNVFVADAATTAGAIVWSETVNVTPNTRYIFSYDGAEVSDPCCSNATFAASVNGVVGATLTATSSWQNSAFVWTSGAATTATLALIDTNASGPYNDFAVDDFSFSGGVPETSTWILMLIGFGALGGASRSARRSEARAA
jgi:hypothetical protein